jgi:mitogen-activated protein kinase 15
LPIYFSNFVWKAIDRRTGEVVAIKKIFDAFRNQTDAQVCENSRQFIVIIFLSMSSTHQSQCNCVSARPEIFRATTSPVLLSMAFHTMPYA